MASKIPCKQYIKNPCRLCLVNPMCIKVCDDLKQYAMRCYPELKELPEEESMPVIYKWIRESILNKKIKDISLRLFDARRMPVEKYYHIDIAEGNIVNTKSGTQPINAPKLKRLKYTGIKCIGYHVKVGAFRKMPRSVLR